MKRKYYLTDTKGKVRIFSSFNALLRTLRLPEEEELKIADVLGTVAFSQNREISYRDEQLGITIDYR